MLKIRFQRTGRKNDPSFRLVVTEHTAAAQAGKNVAQVGSYHPKTKHTLIDAEAVKLWLSRGAKASGTVNNLLITKGIIEGKKVNVLGKKTPIVKETPAETLKAGAPAVEAVAPEVAPETSVEEAPQEATPAA